MAAVEAWLTRSGRESEDLEELGLRRGVVMIGWHWLPDLSEVRSADEVKELLRRHRDYADSAEGGLTKHANEILNFILTIDTGDLVLMPSRLRRGRVAVGRVAGPYQYRTDWDEDARHVRPVEWLNTRVRRDDLDDAVQRTLALRGTVRRMPPGAADGIQAIL